MVCRPVPAGCAPRKYWLSPLSFARSACAGLRREPLPVPHSKPPDLATAATAPRHQCESRTPDIPFRYFPYSMGILACQNAARVRTLNCPLCRKCGGIGKHGPYLAAGMCCGSPPIPPPAGLVEAKIEKRTPARLFTQSYSPTTQGRGGSQHTNPQHMCIRRLRPF